VIGLRGGSGGDGRPAEDAGARAHRGGPLGRFPMVEVDGFLAPERVLLDWRSASKRQLFQDLAAAAAAATGIDAAAILAALNQRERLGTTGIGEGIAIPHARVPDLEQLVGFFARLATPVDYDALDDAPVDLVFLLLAPEEATNTQLKALARIARLLRDPGVCSRLRHEPEPRRIHELLTGGGGGGAARRPPGTGA
jgi:PTS system nitrogen regulatory IIA component